MDLSLLVTYVSATLLLVITPGATTAAVIRNSLRRGIAGGAATALGAAAGNSSHATAAGLGLAILVARVPGAMPLLRAAGGLYLAYLGLSSLRQAWRGKQSVVARLQAGPVAPGRSAFRDGLLVNLFNPPIITFYLMLPAFLPANAGPGMFALLAAIHITMAFTCHIGWSLAFGTLRTALSRPAAMRALEAGAGLALLLLAGRTLASALA